MKKRKILITGASGYLGQKLVRALLEDPSTEKVIGLDVKSSDLVAFPNYQHVQTSVLDDDLNLVMQKEEPDTVVHLTWTFNPTHDFLAQDALDLGGTLNVLTAAVAAGVKHFVYAGSTTAYAPLPDNPSSPPFLKEEEWLTNFRRRITSHYRYARNKALADRLFQLLLIENWMKFFWIRGAIVVGPGTNNIVSYLARSPFTFGRFMFRVAGDDPPMQFISEHDMIEILYRAVRDNWAGVVNVAGEGTLKYSEVIKILGRRELCLPAWLLYPMTEILWRLGIFKFPSSLIDLVRYPWVADTSKLKNNYHYIPLLTSKEALEELAKNL